MDVRSLFMKLVVGLSVAVFSVGTIFVGVASGDNESNDPEVFIESVHTVEQSSEVIGRLRSEVADVRSRFESRNSKYEVALSEVEVLRSDLFSVESSALKPAVDAFLYSSGIEQDSSDPNIRARSSYLGAQAVSANEEAFRKVSELEREVSLAEAELAVLERDQEEVGSEVAVLEQYLGDEQVLYARTQERLIHDRAYDGAVKAINDVQNFGKKQGFLLAACPVAGPHNFADSWSAPRSGGRSHEGADIMAKVGVPLVAPVSGRVEFVNQSLGGLSYRVFGDNGNFFFGTHLSAYEGSARRVEAGEVIGYVGKTGNAASTDPHLHFEVHFGGRGKPINPTDDLRRVCNGFTGVVWRG